MLTFYPKQHHFFDKKKNTYGYFDIAWLKSSRYLKKIF